jgi:hypothetical protein
MRVLRPPSRGVIVNPADLSPRDAEVVGAIVMPNRGESDDHITGILVGLGAQVNRLAPGFLSVRASRTVLRAVAPIARVEEKTPRQMR